MLVELSLRASNVLIKSLAVEAAACLHSQATRRVMNMSFTVKLVSADVAKKLRCRFIIEQNVLTGYVFY